MLYIKSIFTGLLTGAAAMVASTVLWMIIGGYQIHRQFPGVEVSFDLRSALSRPSVLWLAAVVGFAAGFYWRYRRATN